jgi:hypothetical protein
MDVPSRQKVSKMKSYRIAPNRVCTSAALVRAAGLLFPLMLLAVPAFAFPNGYSYCKVVTTQHTMVSGPSDLTNYPLTVVLTDADLKTVANGGLVNNNNGYDIGFGPDCSGAGAMLNWEMESYTATTGAIVAHVLRPTLSHTIDDTVGMYYGGSFSSFQSTATAVWDANFKGVWHFSGSSLSVVDSTGLNSPANNGATSATGKIDGAATTGTSAWVDSGSSSVTSFDKTSTFTISLWAKNTSFSAEQTLVAKMTSGGTYQGYSFDFGLGTSRYINLYLINNYGGNNYINVNTPTQITDGLWHHYVVTYSGSSTAAGVKIYVDGSNQTLTVSKDALSATTVNSVNTSLASRASGNAPFIGLEDEVRISNIVRSSDWILTEYRNQSAPGTYISVGSRIGTSPPVRHRVISGM